MSPGRLVDVSSTGLGLDHDHEIEVGTLLDVVIAEPALALRATVLHSEFRRHAPGLGVFRSGAQLVLGAPLDCEFLMMLWSDRPLACRVEGQARRLSLHWSRAKSRSSRRRSR